MLQAYVSLLILTVRGLAARFPNAVYSNDDIVMGCNYVVGSVKNGPDTTGCIFGQAHRILDAAKVPMPDPMKNMGFIECGQSIITLLQMCEGHESLSSNQLNWCAYVQVSQDRKKTWGEAVADAECYPV